MYQKHKKNIHTGLYHYNIESNSLEELIQEDLSLQLSKACPDQSMPFNALITLIWTAIFQRSKWKYTQRAYSYIYLDAGHIAQNFALCATTLGLGSCQIGAFYDHEINKILGLDGEKESTIYLTTVGYPKSCNLPR